MEEHIMHKRNLFLLPIALLLGLALAFSCAPPDDDDDSSPSVKYADFTVAGDKVYFPAAGGTFDVSSYVTDDKTKGTGAITYEITKPANGLASGSGNAGTRVHMTTGVGNVAAADVDKTIVVTISKAKSTGFEKKSKTVTLTKAAILPRKMTVDNSGGSNDKGLIKITTDQNGAFVQADSGNHSLKSTFTVGVSTTVSGATATASVSVAEVAVSAKVISLTLNKALKHTDMVTLTYKGTSTNYINKSGSSAGADKMPDASGLPVMNKILVFTDGTYDTSNNLLELEGMNLNLITADMVKTLAFGVGSTDLRLGQGVGNTDYAEDSTATSSDGTDVSAEKKWRYKADGTKVWIQISDADGTALEGKATNKYTTIGNGNSVAAAEGLYLAAANANMTGLSATAANGMTIKIKGNAPTLTSAAYNVGAGTLAITGVALPPSGADLSKLSFDVTGSTPTDPVKYQFKAVSDTNTALAYTTANTTWTVTLTGVEKLFAEQALSTTANRFLVSLANWAGTSLGAVDHSNAVTLTGGTPFGSLTNSGTLAVTTPGDNTVTVTYTADSTTVTRLGQALVSANLATYVKVFIIGGGLSGWTELVTAGTTGTAAKLVVGTTAGASAVLATRTNGDANDSAQAIAMSTAAQDITDGPALVAIVASKQALGVSGTGGNYTVNGTTLTVDDTTNVTMAVLKIVVDNQS